MRNSFSFLYELDKVSKVNKTKRRERMRTQGNKTVKKPAKLSEPSNPLIALVSKFVFRAILYVSLHKPLCFRNNFCILDKIVE